MGHEFAEPNKVVKHGPFSWKSYKPIVIIERGGARYIVEDLTRVENARRGGIKNLTCTQINHLAK